MRNKFVILLASLVLMGATSALANEHEGGGANMNLFPPPKADLAKSKRPATPKLVSPSYQAKITTGEVTLKWKAVDAADSYHLQVATDPAFKWLVVNEDMMKDSSFEVKDLKKDAHYFWRVAARKSDNEPTYTMSWFATSAFKTP